jgi:hypothetical protein
MKENLHSTESTACTSLSTKLFLFYLPFFLCAMLFFTGIGNLGSKIKNLILEMSVLIHTLSLDTDVL